MEGLDRIDSRLDVADTVGKVASDFLMHKYTVRLYLAETHEISHGGELPLWLLTEYALRLTTLFQAKDVI